MDRCIVWALVLVSIKLATAGCGPVSSQAALPGDILGSVPGTGDTGGPQTDVSSDGPADPTGGGGSTDPSTVLGGGGSQAGVSAPGVASRPSPLDHALYVSVVPTLSWLGGGGATNFDVYLGSDLTSVSTASRTSSVYQGNVQVPSFSARCAAGSSQYWRIDSRDDSGRLTPGPVWVFVTAPAPGPISNVSPAAGAADVSVTPTLTWTSGSDTTRSRVYLGTSQQAVAVADVSSPDFRGEQTATSYTPGTLERGRTYYWRIDGVGPGGITPGQSLAFSTVRPLAQPVAWPEVEITDSGAGHITGNSPNPECGLMTRISTRMYFLYRANFTTAIDKLYVRPYDLTTRQALPVIQVDNTADEADNGYHSEPTLLRDGSNRLHILNQSYGYVAACAGQYGIAPRWRSILDLATPNAWPAPGCLPSRVLNPGSVQFYDAMGVYDDRSGTTHCVGQMSALGHLDGGYVDNFPRAYYRFKPDGSVDGPYVIVNGATGQPAEVGGTGNVYCKGDLVLGKESSGPHSLHLVWNTRILWDDTLGAQHQWNYNLYYARSDDGGNTWHNIDNTASVALTTHIAWNDARFLAFSGDVDQNSERAFDVDNNGRPFMVVLRYRAGTGTLYGAHVDTSAATVPSYDLTFQYWNGSSWTRGVIDSQVNWTQSRPKARVDADGNFYVFVGESPRYYRSTDGGQTWAAPVIFGNQAGSGWRLYSAPDPLDENYHNVMYQNRATHRLYYTRLQLTNR